MTAKQKGSHIHPATINDVSTGSAGVLANELAAEEESLLHKQRHDEVSYGSSSDANQSPTPDSPSEQVLTKKQLITVISSLYMASYLAALDVTVVTTLLTVIASELNAVENIGWIATAYLVSCSAFQPLFGKLSDIFGRKNLLLICCAFFAIGCCICVTNNVWLLVFGRFVTGWGGSGLTILGTITMSDLIPLRDRGMYQGMANIFFSLGAASGGIVGGLVADLFGWRYVFILQVPLAVLVGIAIYFNLNLPAGSPGLGASGTLFKMKLKRVDFLGSFFLVSSLMMILVAASMGGQKIKYTSPLFAGLIIVALILLAAFIYTEKNISEEPIIPIETMLDRTVISSSLANWFYSMSVFAYLFYIPVFFQAVMGMSATQSGKRLVPNFFAVSAGSLGAGIYMKKTGRYYKFTVIVGLLSFIGSLRFLFLSPQSSLLEQYTILLPTGFGYSCMLTVTLLSLISAVPVKYQASTTSIQYTFRATGSTLGVSIASAIYQSITIVLLRSKLLAIIEDPERLEEVIGKALKSTDYVKELPEYIQTVVRYSYEQGCKGTFVFSVVILATGYLSSLFMREHELHTTLNRD